MLLNFSFNLRRAAFWFSLGISILVLFHFESKSVGPLKVSHLWKGILLSFLLVNVFSGGKVRSTVYNPLILLSIWHLFSFELFYNSANVVFLFLTTIIIPLIGVYSLEKSSRWNISALIFFATFFIVCFIPYEIGLLSSLGKESDLSVSLGFDVNRLIGPFQTAHSASTALAGSILVVAYLYFQPGHSRIALFCLLVLGLFFLLNTFVRTGMAMVAVGLFVLFGSSVVKSHKSLIRVLLLVLLFAPLVNLWVFSNEAMMAKLMGQRVHSSELESFESLGSGRGGLGISALKIYSDSSIIEKIIGIGPTIQKIRMNEVFGAPLYPHNGFIELLVHNGIVGFFLFVWFLFAMYKSIRNLPRAQSRSFLMALYFAYVLMTFFQSFAMLYMLVLLMLSYAYEKNRVDDAV